MSMQYTATIPYFQSDITAVRGVLQICDRQCNEDKIRAYILNR